MFPPIIALDFPDLGQAERLLTKFDAATPLFIKVGMELFYGNGPEALTRLQAAHPASVFLDLKLHDIPHTVERAAYQLGRLGVQLTTAHAAGGAAMLEAANRGLAAGAKAAGKPTPRLLAITQLTSTDQAMLNTQLTIPGTVAASVQHLAQLAEAAGCAGVVASAREVPLIRAVTQPDFLIVTPGIRPTGSAADDQVRITTPAQARALGSDAIVVGRPITQAADPMAAYASIAQAWRN